MKSEAHDCELRAEFRGPIYPEIAHEVRVTAERAPGDTNISRDTVSG